VRKRTPGSSNGHLLSASDSEAFVVIFGASGTPPLAGRHRHRAACADPGIDLTGLAVFFGAAITRSRIACFRACLRARRSASALSRVVLSDGFPWNRRRFISRKIPSRCIFFFRTTQCLVDIVVANKNLQD
jgi:hypothetical protein